MSSSSSRKRRSKKSLKVWKVKEKPSIFSVQEENGFKNVYNLAGTRVYSKSINREELKHDLAQTLKKKFPERITLLFEND